MVAMTDTEPIEPFGRYRFRGLDPKSVELWAVNFENENATLRDQIAALEARATEADAFAEDAVREMVALQEIVKRAETDQAMFVTRQRLFREEAAQIVHDAWAEASVVRAQTQQHIDRTQAQLAAARATQEHHLEAMRETMMGEIEATIDRARAAMAAECAEHQSRIAALEQERAQIVTEIEACTAGVLGRIAALKQTAEPTAAHDADDATDALTLLVTTIQRSLTVPVSEIGMFAPNE